MKRMKLKGMKYRVDKDGGLVFEIVAVHGKNVAFRMVYDDGRKDGIGSESKTVVMNWLRHHEATVVV